MSKKSLGTLTLDLIAKVGGFEKGLDKATRHTNKRMREIKKSSQTAARAIGAAFAAIGAAVGTKEIIEATIRQENALRQLEARLKSTEGAAGLSSEELQNLAGTMQQLTTFGDEAVMEMEALLLTFTNIQGEVFKRATPAILDMSVAMGTDLRSSAVQLGKALNDPIKGISALSRTGIQFTDAQKSTIEALVESGRTAEAQGLILEELEKQFGGAAEAAADTFGGALKQAQNAFGDLLESEGGLNEGKAALQELTKLLQDPATKKAAAALTNGLIKGFTAVSKVVTDTVNTVQYLAEEFAAITVGIHADDIVRLERDAQRIRDVLDSNDFGQRLRFFGPKGVVEYWNDEELKTELARLESAIDTYYKPRSKIAGNSTPAPAGLVENTSLVTDANPEGELLPPVDHWLIFNEVIEELGTEFKTAKEEAEALQRNKEAYAGLLRDLRTDEEVLTDQMRERLAIVDAMAGLTEEQRASTLGRIADAATEDGPTLGGLGSGEDIETARTELEDWYSTQLQMLEQFRSERADLNATWDEEELSLRQQYEERLTEITQANEDLRRQQQLDGYSVLMQVASDYYSGMEGEEAAYMRAALSIGGALLDEKKRNALQSVIANTQDAAMGAYKAMASIPYVGPVLGAAAAGAVYVTGGLAAAKITGMAHDGIDAVPEDGTWLLQKGERVTTSETSAKLDRTLAMIQADMHSGGGAGDYSRPVSMTQNIRVDGTVNNRTATQLARESERKQRINRRRLGS
ncbi:phage tail length tape measure family protein [Microbulbifer variabilis]|uniref:Phage tail length tape measure family protein n=2 Tax=Microbulbifer TaxID=48073 RepID=A0ABY4V708_9GAMM|nr:phage tail length tape measure family protein [Microbulbifer variabilis]USD19962.1 phage tail length tape measure family protein [Microbulbifer variabilis]